MSESRSQCSVIVKYNCQYVKKYFGREMHGSNLCCSAITKNKELH